MPIQTEEQIMNFSKDQMFDLVADIDSYSQFLPWCDNSNIISTEVEENGNTMVIADLDIGYKSLSYTYRSEVKLSKNKDYIKVNHIEGPFKHLINEWRFEELSNNKCKISFFIDFELSSKIFNLLMNEFFDLAFKRMVSSFQDRAESIYSNQ